MNKFEKECLEKIPPSELRSIHDTVDEMLRKAVDMKLFSYYGWCDHCTGVFKREHMPKQPCICRPYEGDTICASCWAKEQEMKLCREYIAKHKPKLDLEDFARI